MLAGFIAGVVVAAPAALLVYFLFLDSGTDAAYRKGYHDGYRVALEESRNIGDTAVLLGQ